MFTSHAAQPRSSRAGIRQRFAATILMLVTSQGLSAVALSSQVAAPLYFEPVEGSAPPELSFASRMAPLAVSISKSGLEIHPPSSDGLRLLWLGRSAGTQVVGGDPLPGKSNYFIGDRSKWRTGVPHYGRVAVSSIYPGVDAVFYGTGAALEYDIAVAPGADLGRIRIRIDGARGLKLDAEGNLVIGTRSGSLLHRRPRSHQDLNGKRAELPSRYKIVARNVIGFEVEGADRKFPLTIDPVLAFSTYYGGTDSDIATAIAVDNSGNAYFTGSTTSTDFPVQNATQGYKKGPPPSDMFAADVFVVKIDTINRTVIYSTYLGSSGCDGGLSIAADAEGNAYVTGVAGAADFPLVNPIRSTYEGGEAFVTKLSSTGVPVYSTFLGGTSAEEGTSIYVDGDGSAYVAGWTASPDFPAFNAYQAPQRGSADGFVAKLNPSGSALEFSSILSGSSGASVSQVVLDGSGNILLVGTTQSADFPLVNPVQTAPSPPNNVPVAFATKMNPSASALIYSTVLGASASQVGFNGSTSGVGIAADSSGNAWIFGQTNSLTFPLLNPIQSTPGRNDCFLTRLTPVGALAFSTLFGSGADEDCAAVALDSAGRVWIAGATFASAEGMDFPLLDAVQTTGSNWNTNFVAQVASDGSAILFSTFLGTAAGQINPGGMAVDSAESVYLAGTVWASGFPTAQPIRSYSGSQDAFLSKITGQTQCMYAVSPLVPPAIPPEGGSGTVSVTTQSGCLWNAVSHNLVSIGGPNTAPGGGSLTGYGTWYLATGSGQVSFLLPYGEGPDQTFDILVAGKRVTVNQQGYGCNPQMLYSTSTIPAGGGSAQFLIVDMEGCPYQAISNASWIVLQQPASGTTGGIVRFTVGPNNTCADRQGTISVGTLTHTVTQPVLGCVLVDGIATYASGHWLVDVNGNGAFDQSVDQSFFLGWTGAIPVTGDWNGDGRTKAGVYSNGYWYLDYNGDGVWDGGVQDKLVAWGWAGATPVVGDWNGDGKTKIGVYCNGMWFLDYNGDFAWDGGVVDKQVGWGWAGVTPIVGDWNGDGKTKIGVYSNGFWFLDYDGNYQWDGGNVGVDKAAGWGWAGVTPIVGDWNGDGRTKIGVYAGGYWYVDHDGTYLYDPTKDIWQMGWTGTTPVMGDWNGDGKTKAGAFINGYWYLDYTGVGVFDSSGRIYAFGQAGDTPVVGRW